jgi:hypothetical protein
MSASNEPCESCGGSKVNAAVTHHCGEGENVVAYHQYSFRCSQCGLTSSDPRQSHLNAAGAAAAKAVSLGR